MTMQSTEVNTDVRSKKLMVSFTAACIAEIERIEAVEGIHRSAVIEMAVRHFVTARSGKQWNARPARSGGKGLHNAKVRAVRAT
jgi:hypothetical protein